MPMEAVLPHLRNGVLPCERKNCTTDSTPSPSSGEYPSSRPVSLSSLHTLFTEELSHCLLATYGGLTFLTGGTKAKSRNRILTSPQLGSLNTSGVYFYENSGDADPPPSKPQKRALVLNWSVHQKQDKNISMVF